MGRGPQDRWEFNIQQPLLGGRKGTQALARGLLGRDTGLDRTSITDGGGVGWDSPRTGMDRWTGGWREGGRLDLPGWTPDRVSDPRSGTVA